MKKNCYQCHTEHEHSNLNYRGECPTCETKRKRQEDDDESSGRLRNMLMGDVLNTGIPGGIDLDITTPL
jgi:hypothetical protein